MAKYIEREALIKQVMANFRQASWYGCDNPLYSIVEETILEAPTSDVAPVVHGRWEPCFEDWRKEIDGDRCSACGFEHYGNCISNYNYCPNCGAKMDLKNESEEK